MNKFFLLSIFFMASVCTISGQPGTLDLSFGNNGIVTNVISFGYYAVKVQQDDKIVTCGYVRNSNDDYLIARYKPNGTPDSTFGVNGFVTQDLGGNDYPYSILIQQDGKIVVGGQVDDLSADFAISRFLTAFPLFQNRKISTLIQSYSRLTVRLSSAEKNILTVQAFIPSCWQE